MCHVCFMKMVHIVFQCPHPSAHKACVHIVVHLFFNLLLRTNVTKLELIQAWN